MNGVRTAWRGLGPRAAAGRRACAAACGLFAAIAGACWEARAQGAPAVNLKLSGTNLAEAAASVTLRATLTAATNVPVSIGLDFAGTATWQADYTRTTNVLTVVAGNTSSTIITLKAVQDGLDEANETILVSLGAISNAVAGETNQVAATILDDDAPPSVTLKANESGTLTEAYGVATLSATLSTTSALPVSVALAFSGSAQWGADYACAASNLVIAAHTWSATLDVRGLQDAALEGVETVVADLAAASNATESGVQRVTIDLADDDQPWVGIGGRVTAWTNAAPASRARLGVRREGVYRVAAADLAAALGVSAATVQGALAGRGLSLSRQGRPVAWAAEGDALYFYGVPTGELYAPENVYWLALGAGAAPEAFDASPDPAAATNAWFMRAQSFRAAFLAPYDPRDRRSGAGSLTNVLNFGEWLPGVAAESSRARSRVVELPGLVASAATGVIARASLASYLLAHDFTQPDNHLCEVRLDGASLGAQGWSGERAVTFDYAAPPGAVTNGPAEVTVRNASATATDEDDVLLLDVEVHYPCEYAARGGLLLCGGGADGTVSAGGFASAQLRVWDVTEPDAPLALGAPVWQEPGGAWRTAFACGDAATRYAVFDAGEGYLEPSVSGVRDTDWFNPAEMPACAIVIPPRRWAEGFEEAVRPLADFRNAQGLHTRVIDAEELYNAFSDGLVHPQAFVRFCAAGVTNGPAPTLRYLLFAGHAGTDYKLEVFRLGEQRPYPSLFPLLLVSQIEESQTAALLLPNDVSLGDVVGHAAPEVAVGRFLATNAAELAWAVDKTIRYELAASWKRRAVFTADWQNVGDKYANFVGISSNTAVGFAEAGWLLETFFPGPTQSYVTPLWRYDYDETGAYYELREGAGFFYYVGHSSDTLAGSSAPNKFFDSNTFRLADWPFSTVGFLMGCRMGRWTLYDLRELQQCIAEAAVRNRDSGFAAAVASAGYSTTGDAALFSYACRNQVEAGALRLGDVWVGAFQALGHAFTERSRHIVLLGDPALVLRCDRTALGTDTAWLVDHGLTGDPRAEFTDLDGDGFAAWQEYAAGTSPTQTQTRIRAFAAGGAARVLHFEANSNRASRILSTTNLAGGVWQELPWRPVAGEAWSTSGIPADWPVEAVEVPADSGAAQRFYRVEQAGE